MASLSVTDEAGLLPKQAVPAGEPIVRVSDDLAAIEPLWRAFEADAIAAPYQRYDWVRSYADAMLRRGERLRVATVHDADGTLAMIWPMVVRRRYGLRVATPPGDKHVNMALPLLRPDRVLDDGAARRLVSAIGRSLGVDLVVCRNAPMSWKGCANPMAIGGQPSPSNAYAISLTGDPEATLAAASTTMARKKLRNKERGLAKLGQVDFFEAKDAASVDLILGAFLRQKKRRFDELGIADPFAEEGTDAFIRSACLAGLENGTPAIELCALAIDGEPVAIIGGASDRDRFSGMFISFESAGEPARFSPGEILVARTIRRQCERGRTTFDLGVGEARYKRIFCNDVEHLVDNVIAVSPAGSLYGLVLAVATAGKRRLKASPAAMRMLARIRRARSRGASPANVADAAASDES